MLRFSTDNLERVFSKPENDYEGFKKMMYDYTHGRDIYDEEGKIVSKNSVNDKINSVCFDILGLEEGSKPSKRQIKRAMKKHGVELYEVLEDTIDIKVATGFKDNEFFNTFVEMKNVSDGDRNEFWTDKDVILTVAKTSGDAHDLTMQKLGEGEAFSVKTANYAVKVGMDIDAYLLGRKDWSEYVDAISRAFNIQIQNDMFTEVMAAGDKLPTNEQFNVTKELVAANKDRFDELLSDVSTANDGVDIVIMGTKTALKKLNALADIDWISEDQKKQVAELGRLGSYEGTTLVEIPQRFAVNDVTKKLIPTDKLLIMPNVDNKFVKFVDVGETEILEVTDKGERQDDFMTHEVQREMGIATIIDKYHGVWTIA
jgi:hypothetical protein